MAEQMFIQCKALAVLSKEFLQTGGAYKHTCCRAGKERSPILEGVRP